MRGEFDGAERALNAATAIPGAPASVFMRLGVAMLNQGRHADAVRELERALALNPGGSRHSPQSRSGQSSTSKARQLRALTSKRRCA